MSSTSLRWALLGASDIAATRMIPAFRAAGHEVVVVQSGSSEWAAEYARTHGIGAWTTSVDEAVARADVDAVYVSSKNDRHRRRSGVGRPACARRGRSHCPSPTLRRWSLRASAGVVMATNHHLPASPVHRTVSGWSPRARLERCGDPRQPRRGPS